MTETEARKILVDAARSYLGFSEASGKHRAIIDIYNSKTPLPRGYKVTYSDPWCATFVSAMAIQTGMCNIIPRECGCPEMVKKFKEMERWQKADYIPKAGDICYYDWQRDGVPDHVGIVESVSEGSVTVIEGNKNDSVERRHITVGAESIYGYGTPDFAWWAKEQNKQEKPKDDPWYIKDGSWAEAKKLGLFNGERPNDNITRAEAAVVALRVLKLAKGEKL